MLLAALVLAAAAPAPPERYDYIVKDFVAGALERSEAGGKVEISFSYRDNGRGPTMKESYALDKDGTTSAFRCDGTTTFGSKIEERFERAAGAGKWKTLIDEGEAKTPGFYVPLTSSPEHMAVLARALLLAPKQTLALLPAGQATIEKVRTEELGQDKAKKKVTLYAITGLDLTPVYVWLDDTTKAFFAAVASGPYGLIRSEYKAYAKFLGILTKQADETLLVALHKKTRHRIDAPLAITNVDVFDATRAKIERQKTVYMFRGAIGSIVPASEPLAKDAYVVDGTGKTLMPALIDAHGHEGEWTAPFHIAGGVTTVRDIGNDNDEFLALMRRVDDGTYLGPRYLGRAGFLEGESEHASRGSGLAGSLDEAKRWVDWYAQHGYRQLKIYNSFKPEWVPATVAYAHERGLRVSGHVPAFTTATQMVRAGFDELQHINQIFLNFFVGPKDDTRTLLRFELVGDKGYTLDLASKEVQQFVALLRDRRVAVDPTLGAFESMYRQAMGEPSPTYGMIADHFPALLQRSLRQADMEATPQKREIYRKSYRRMLDMVAKMEKSGVAILPGTDGFAGFLLHRELELYVEAGIAPARVLQIATRETARELGFDRLGTITPGFCSDTILVEGDPTQDISAVRKIAMVTRGEDIYYPAEIYAALGVKPFVPPIAIAPPKP